MMTIEKLREIINDPQTSPANLAKAQEMLAKEEERLASIGSASVQTAIQSGGDDELNAILAGLEAALKGGGGKVSMADVRRAVNEELTRRKINMGDLAPDILQFLNSQRTVTFVMKMMNISTSTNTKPDFINRPLTQLVLSDVMAKNNVYLYGGAGTGKAQPLTAKILCENGWKTFSDIKVGDKVFGEDGNLHTVNGVYDRGVKSVYRSYMNDGAYADTCNEHLWQVSTRSQRGKGNQGKVLQLSEFMHKIKTNEGYANAYIPVTKSISFPEKPHVVHPYTMGVLIGDGGLSVHNRIMITNPSEEIFENLILPLENKLSKINTGEKCLTYSIVSKQNNTSNVMVSELKKVGLSGKKSLEKFIPKEYLYDSLENRIELLQGLNDTDAYCDGTAFEYSTSSVQLAEDYCELVRGLGGTARSVKRKTFYTHNGIRKAGEESYRIYCVFPDNVIPFKYSEKKNKYKKHTKYKVKRYFDRVEYLGEMPVKCISVTNPTKLYLTDNYIVTHNTFVASKIAKLLGWELITLNCNQFTSPLDILGGQTIDGYQEGKLSMAWKNVRENPDGTSTPLNGCVLLLDELPKIDPNTAGILNEALAKVKEFDMEDGQIVRPTITNGRNVVLELKNLFVIATGNVPLNTIDPDYEANFKQDLSLQDRFVGSTYEILVDYQVEWDSKGKGFAFIWLFLVKVREKIKEVRATNQAFVSMRLIINVIETYKIFRDVVGANSQNVGALSGSALTKPKTIKDSLDTFFNLFKDAPKQAILQDVDYKGFLELVEKKNKMPYDPEKPDFDTQEEIDEAQRIIKKNQEEIRKKYS